MQEHKSQGVYFRSAAGGMNSSPKADADGMDAKDNKISSAMRELFTMKNAIDGDYDPTDLSPTVGGNPILLNKGDVANVLNQFREVRNKELQEERDRQRIYMREMLLSSPPVDVDDEADPPSVDLDVVGKNRFFDDYDYSDRIERSASNSPLQDFATSNIATVAPLENKIARHSPRTESSQLGSESDITPPHSPKSDMQGKFYQFVRSPKREDRSESVSNSGATLVNTRRDRAEESEGIMISSTANAFSLFDSPKRGRRVQHDEVPAVYDVPAHVKSTIFDNSIEAHRKPEASNSGAEQEQEPPSDDFKLRAASVSSEPAVDQEALENTLRNQVMLYESSQQLQLGGAFSSWALGGSVESLGGSFPPGQHADGSIDKLDGSVERAVGELGRSVTFANETDVREFENEPAELPSDVAAFSRGSRLEDEDGPGPPLRRGLSDRLYTPHFDSEDRIHAVHEPSPKIGSKHSISVLHAKDEDVAPIRFPDDYGWHSDESGERVSDTIGYQVGHRSQFEESAADMFESEFNDLGGEKCVILDADLDSSLADTAHGVAFDRGSNRKDVRNERAMNKSEPYVESKSYRHDDGISFTPIGRVSADPAAFVHNSANNHRADAPTRRTDSGHTETELRPQPKLMLASSYAHVSERTKSPSPTPTQVVPDHDSAAKVKDVARPDRTHAERAGKGAAPKPAADDEKLEAQDLETAAERRRREQTRLEELCRPFPDKTLRGKPPRSSMDCPNIPFDHIDEAQAECESESVLQGIFSPATEKVRIVLRAQLQQDDNFRDLLKKLPKQKKNYGLSELKIFRDNVEALEPQQIVNSLFGGPARARASQKTEQQQAGVTPPLSERDSKSRTDLKRPDSPKRYPFSQTMSNPARSGKESTYMRTEMVDAFGESAGTSRTSGALNGQSLGPFTTQHFLRRFCHGFMCVALDFYMNVIGTYDMASGLYMAGLNFDPRFATKSPSCTADVLSALSDGSLDLRKTKERPSLRQANVLEIDFSCIPSNVFALVPVIFDDSVPTVRNSGESGASGIASERGDIPAAIQGMRFDCVMYSCAPATLREYDEAEANIDTPEQASFIGEINGMEKYVTEALRTNMKSNTKRAKAMKKAEQDLLLKQHLSTANNDVSDRYAASEFDSPKECLWSTQCSMMYSRSSNAAEKIIRRGSIVQISNDLMQCIPLGLREAFIPMVLYRRSTDEKGWAWKSLKTVTKGLHSSNADHVINTILESMVNTNVLPFHAVHVEHCDNCEAHAMSTRHTPGSYKQQFVDIQSALQKDIPQLFFQSNLQVMLKGEPGSKKPRKPSCGMKEPRVGSFEVIMRPYCSSVSQLIYSKLATNTFPKSTDLAHVMSGYLRPKPMLYLEAPILDVIVYCKNTKRPLANLDVVVYLLDVHTKGSSRSKDSNYAKVVQHSPDNGTMEVVQEDSIASDDDKDSSASPAVANNSPLDNEDTGTDDQGGRDITPNLNTPHRKPVQTKVRRESPKSIALRDVSHTVIQDPAFSAVGSWGRRDVLAWFESHKVSQDVRFFAEQAGVISGHALVYLVNENNLRKWGCTNRRVLTSLLRDIERMSAAISHDHPDKVGLSNHRIQHMLETSKLMGKSTSIISGGPQTAIGEFAAGSSSMIHSMKRQRDINGSKSLSQFNHTSADQLMENVKTTRVGRNLNVVTVASGKTSDIGMIRCQLHQVGTYLVKVSSLNTVPLWSHVITLGADAEKRHLLWASKIESKVGLVRVQLSEDVYSHVMSYGLYTKNGVMIPFTNMETQRRHIVYMFRKDTAPGKETDPLVNDVLLPVGKYFANICGTIFNVTSRTHRRGAPSDGSARVVAYTDEKRKLKVKRWHDRIVRTSSKKLVECRIHLRRMHAIRSTNRLVVDMRIRSVLRGYLKRARERLLPRRVTRIQCAWRCYFARLKLKEMKARAAKLAAIALLERKKKARINWRVATVFLMCLLRLTKRLHKRRLIKRSVSVLLIQCAWRRKKAYVYARFHRKLRSCSLRSLFVFKCRLILQITRRRNKKKSEAHEVWKQSHNLGLMLKEEERMREYVVRLAQAEELKVINERKRAAEKIRQLEMRKLAAQIKLNKMATYLQAWARGCDVRNWKDLYIAKSRGLIRTVHGGRPVRRYMFDSDSESSEEMPPPQENPVDEDVSFIRRHLHKVSRAFEAVRQKISKSLNRLASRQISRELEEARRDQYARRRTYGPERLLAVRRQSMMYRLPGMHEAALPVLDEELSEELEPAVEPSAFKKYIYGPDIISKTTKDRIFRFKEEVKNKAINTSQKGVNMLRSTPKKVSEVLSKAIAKGANKVLKGTQVVGFAGVRGLRSLKQRLKQRTVPSIQDIKHASVKLIQSGIALPKTFMVQSGVMRLTSRDLPYMSSQQQQEHAVTVLQSSWRGYITRITLLRDPTYRARLADVVRLALDRERAAAEASVAKTEIPAPTSVAPSLPSKKKLKASALSQSTFPDIGFKAIISSAKGFIQDAASKVNEKMSEYVDKKRIALERESRRAKRNFGLNDALLQVAGTLSHCPALDRQWHIGVYPKGTVINSGLLGSLRILSTGGADQETLNTGVTETHLGVPLSGQGDSETSRENIVQSKDKGEHFRSISSYPLSKQTFAAASFNAHLTDLHRYHELEIAIFVETLGVTYTPPVGTLPNAPFDAENSPALSTNSFFFAPAFIATINLAGGGAFSPSGGRMHIKLRPNPSVVGNLPQAKKFLSMDGLGVVITLMPIASPPSSFLRSFRGYARPAPCYPSGLVDATLLDGCSIDWNARNGGATCVGSFRDRLFVASSARGTSVCVHEYANTGACLGSIVDVAFGIMGDITSIVGGLHHLVCCSNTGKVMVMEYLRRDAKSSHEYSWSKPCYILNNEAQGPIAAACIAAHAGMDILFVADRSGAVTVALLSGGACIRSYRNESFVYPASITCMVVCSLRLYLGLSDGTIAVISLFNIIEEGLIELAGNLQDYVLSRDACFHSDAGITCMRAVSGNNFLGFRDEDDLLRSEGDPKKPRKLKKDNVLEGHILLVGGGDLDPTIKVLQPQNKGMRLLSTLSGHTRGVTAIAVDAAGRSFFSLSTDDHSVLAWDGLTFRQERRVAGELFVRGLSLADDCLLVVSDKAPFLKFWRVRAPEYVRVEPNQDSAKFTDSKLGPDRAILEHDADSLTVACVRDQDWCRDRLNGVLRVTRASALLRSAPEDLDARQRQQVVYRWLTQYRRIEVTPTVKPSLLGVASSSSRASDTLAMNLRAKTRREQQIRAHADRAVNNTLPGSPDHIAALKTLSQLSAENDYSDEEVEDFSTRKAIGSTFGSRGTIDMVKSGISPDMKRFIAVGQKSRIAFDNDVGSDDGGENLDEDGDEHEYKKLFPGPTPEAKRKQAAEMVEKVKEDKTRVAQARATHRLNTHAHFSDSDEEDGNRILYLKPIKLTKAELRARSKQAATSQPWMNSPSEIGSPPASRPTNKKNVSTAVLISSPSPDKPSSFQIFREDDAYELTAKTKQDDSPVLSKTQRGGGFYRTLVKDLRDIDVDDE